ncbi:MAG: hypothetical protein UY62_C0093G0006, partial [Parcubacteria group bacterium GW2011_GWF2_50_9]
SPIKDKEIEPRSRPTKSISLFSVQLLSSATVPSGDPGLTKKHNERLLAEREDALFFERWIKDLH